MKAREALPVGYRQIFSVDLQKDKKTALWVNLLALVIAVGLAVPMHFYRSVFSLFDMSAGLSAYFLRFGAMLVLMVAYMVLHELIHGVFMKAFGAQRVHYGFTGLYAFAGSEAYFNKKPYLIIALAPVVLLGLLIGIVNPLVPEAWFWVVYFIQLLNLSGAAGDLYVTVKFARLPRDILAQDSGVAMAVYSTK